MAAVIGDLATRLVLARTRYQNSTFAFVVADDVVTPPSARDIGAAIYKLGTTLELKYAVPSAPVVPGKPVVSLAHIALGPDSDPPAALPAAQAVFARFRAVLRDARAAGLHPFAIAEWGRCLRPDSTLWFHSSGECIPLAVEMYRLSGIAAVIDAYDVAQCGTAGPMSSVAAGKVCIFYGPPLVLAARCASTGDLGCLCLHAQPAFVSRPT
ncbi:MAG: hypothetical protein ACPGR8_16640 [Limisphaerales bacterium]